MDFTILFTSLKQTPMIGMLLKRRYKALQLNAFNNQLIN